MWPLRGKFGKHAGLYNRHTLFFLNDDINTDNDELGQGLCLFKTALYNKEQICSLLYSFLWLETLACTEKLYLEDGQRAKAETKQNETYLKKERAFDSCKDLLSLYPLSQLAMSKNFSVQAANHI